MVVGVDWTRYRPRQASHDPAAAPSPRAHALVGNTPLLAIHLRFRGRLGVVYAKAENLNMTGSVKDRMGLHILVEARKRGQLAEGGLVVEATSGNTGISFAAIGRALGHPVALFMPDWVSQEWVNLIRSFGATVHSISAAEGGFQGAIRLADEFAAATPGAFLPHQFANQDNCRAHEQTTGPEIASQLRQINRFAECFVAGVGTGGTIMGVGRYLRRVNRRIRLHPVEPAESPTANVGCKVGSHRIQGIADEFIPSILDLTFLDAVLGVHDGDAILMAQRLARDLGLAVGIFSGANFLGRSRPSADSVPTRPWSRSFRTATRSISAPT